MTKDKVAKMLGKKEFKPVENKVMEFNAGKVIKDNVGEFKGDLKNMKSDLKSKLPKPKKFSKMTLGGHKK